MSKKKKTYQKGFPEKRGLYDCKVNGNETVLVLHKCDMTCKAWWMTVDGHDVIGDVEWSGLAEL